VHLVFFALIPCASLPFRNKLAVIYLDFFQTTVVQMNSTSLPSSFTLFMYMSSIHELSYNRHLIRTTVRIYSTSKSRKFPLYCPNGHAVDFSKKRMPRCRHSKRCIEKAHALYSLQAAICACQENPASFLQLQGKSLRKVYLVCFFKKEILIPCF